jgi:hypothetical protein
MAGAPAKPDAAETGLTRELETLSAGTSPATAVALSALRGRIAARSGELETERARLTTRCAALDTAAAPPQTPASWTTPWPGRHPGTRPPPTPGPPVRRLRHPGPLQPRRQPGHHPGHPHRHHPDTIAAIMADDAGLTARPGMSHLVSAP